MLNQGQVRATLPSSDFDRAKAFYKDKLGLSPARDDEEGATYEAGDSEFLLFPSSGKASGDHTQVAFRVDDIEATLADLRSRGVDFLEYDLPGLKTENGIATFGDGSRGAWFQDSEGNLLAIVQEG